MRNLSEVRAAYERGEGCMKELAERYNIPYSTLTRRCFSEEWRKPRSRRGIAQFSVNAYAYIHGLWLTRQQLDSVGGRAYMRCRAQHIQRGIKDDDRFGAVFTYPVDILASVFAKLNPRVSDHATESEEQR